MSAPPSPSSSPSPAVAVAVTLPPIADPTSVSLADKTGPEAVLYVDVDVVDGQTSQLARKVWFSGLQTKKGTCASAQRKRQQGSEGVGHAEAELRGQFVGTVGVADAIVCDGEDVDGDDDRVVRLVAWA